MRSGIRVILVLLAALGPVAASLADSCTVDPTWIGGFWDGADGDEVVLAASWLDGLANPDATGPHASGLRLLGPLEIADSIPLESASRPQPSIRAPPAT